MSPWPKKEKRKKRKNKDDTNCWTWRLLIVLFLQHKSLKTELTETGFMLQRTTRGTPVILHNDCGNHYTIIFFGQQHGAGQLQLNQRVSVAVVFISVCVTFNRNTLI